ncbi:unnamed protein product [Durusdinium trenchii]|uniref:Uncharacterized protein n=1 Tax=Durusdinium trenchii TaxID=1381693 RepID=A0ABP0SWI1_9DINO
MAKWKWRGCCWTPAPTRHRDGLTALMLAAANGHVEVARLLLNAGADKDLQDKKGSTALILAAQQGHAEAARLLLQAGADKALERFNLMRKGRTAWEIAKRHGHQDVLEVLRSSQESPTLHDLQSKDGTAQQTAAEPDEKITRL